MYVYAYQEGPGKRKDAVEIGKNKKITEFLKSGR